MQICEHFLTQAHTYEASVNGTERLLFATGLLLLDKMQETNSDAVITKAALWYQVYTDFTLDIRMHWVFLLLK